MVESTNTVLARRREANGVRWSEGVIMVSIGEVLHGACLPVRASE